MTLELVTLVGNYFKIQHNIESDSFLLTSTLFPSFSPSEHKFRRMAISHAVNIHECMRIFLKKSRLKKKESRFILFALSLRIIKILHNAENNTK